MNRRDMIQLHALHAKQQRLEEALAEVFNKAARDLGKMSTEIIINRNKITAFLAIQENIVIVDS